MVGPAAVTASEAQAFASIALVVLTAGLVSATIVLAIATARMAAGSNRAAEAQRLATDIQLLNFEYQSAMDRLREDPNALGEARDTFFAELHQRRLDIRRRMQLYNEEEDELDQ